MGYYRYIFTKNRMVCFMLLCVFSCCIGCMSIKSYYPIYEHPKHTLSSLKPLPVKPTIEFTFDFQTNGVSASGVTNKWSPYFVQVLEGTKLFSRINPKGTPSDYTLYIQMNNVCDSLGGAYAQGFMSGLTFGTVGTKVTDNYVVKAHLQNNAGQTVKKEYSYGLVSTSGLIKGDVKNATEYKTLDEAFKEIIDQIVYHWLLDMEKETSFN
jgi:hypothetical protein